LAERRGSDIASLLQKRVLGPMGITLDGWVKNSDGDVFTGSELRLHPRDMLRFGAVYLSDGRIDGQQLIPKEWIVKSRTPQRSVTGRDGIAYSYGWWLTKLAGQEVQFAEGYGGQAIVIAPDAGQVFVFTAPTGGLVTGAKHDARTAKYSRLQSTCCNKKRSGKTAPSKHSQIKANLRFNAFLRDAQNLTWIDFVRVAEHRLIRLKNRSVL